MSEGQLQREIDNYIGEQRVRMIELQRLLTAIPAMSPDNNGDGEWKKADALLTWLKQHGFPTPIIHAAQDERAAKKSRPNIVVTLPGRSSQKTVWIISHLDVVPPGDPSLWHSDPWTLKIVDDSIIVGRGVEDNQQGLVASIFALEALIKKEITPQFDCTVLFVADEETGSSYGLDYLVRERDLFRKDDIIVIPDAGNEMGTMIEIAEKTILWLRFTTQGKQTHASRPGGGVNAFRAGTQLLCELDKFFHQRFTRSNSLFDPPVSTFEPTMKEANVPNINTIPGKDVFCFDCRILPEENIAAILKDINSICHHNESLFGVTITLDIVQQTTAAPPTSPTSPVVIALTAAIKDVYQVDAQPIGIGGGTVANFLRLADIPVAVWSKHDKAAHQPDEYCRIDNMIGDARVFSRLFLL